MHFGRLVCYRRPHCGMSLARDFLRIFMAQLSTVVRYLDSLLQPKLYTDRSVNGLQVEGATDDIRLVALAVDAGLSVVEKAMKAEADLLIVHHGILWGDCSPITGAFGRKISELLSAKCSLYASHIPLDAHTEVGNNFELARFFGLSDLQPCFEHKGQLIGVKGRVQGGKELSFFVDRAKEMTGAIAPLPLSFGKQKIESAGIITGAGAFALEEAAHTGVDLFITGEPRQEAYHLARELKINALFAGHYATETFGVRAVGKKLEKDFDVKTLFIDEPTGI
jgi:dinuclear metal center YbgI/SA1388 family protein